MVQPFFKFLERCRHVEDRAILLQRDDAAGGKGAAVKVALDTEGDFIILIARTHEIGVHRMRDPLVTDGILRRSESLCNHLPAKDPALAPRLSHTEIPAIAHAVDGKKLFKLGNERVLLRFVSRHDGRVSSVGRL